MPENRRVGFFDSHCTSALSFFAFFITLRQPHTVYTLNRCRAVGTCGLLLNQRSDV